MIVVSHKNTLRCLFKHIQGLSESDLKRLEVPNAQPIVYEFDNNNQFLKYAVLKELGTDGVETTDP